MGLIKLTLISFHGLVRSRRGFDLGNGDRDSDRHRAEQDAEVLDVGRRARLMQGIQDREMERAALMQVWSVRGMWRSHTDGGV